MRTELPTKLIDDIELFARNAGQVADLYSDEVSTQEIPELIYHYTDDDGLQGILESGELWLTDILKLNDPSEIKFGIDHAVSVMKKAAANADEVAVEFADRLSEILPGKLTQVAKFYSLSFSEAEDDLPQWQTYANNGKGYALAFDGRAIENAFIMRNGIRVLGTSTFPITYNKCTVTDNHSCDLECNLSVLAKKIIPSVIPLACKTQLAGYSNCIRSEYLRKLSVALASPILQIATMFKHFAYAHEKEYRFLQISGSGCNIQLDVRRRPHQLVEYAKFGWRRFAPNALRKVIAGPAADKLKAHRFIEDCLRLYCGHYVDIGQSYIPYRPS